MSITKPIDLDQLEEETKHLPGFKVILIVLREVYEYSEESEGWIFNPEKLTEKVYNFILIYLEVLSIDAATVTDDEQIVNYSKEINEILDRKTPFNDKHDSLINYFKTNFAKEIDWYKNYYDILFIEKEVFSFNEEDFDSYLQSKSEKLFNYDKPNYFTEDLKYNGIKSPKVKHITSFILFFIHDYLNNLYLDTENIPAITNENIKTYFIICSLLNRSRFTDHKSGDYLLCDKNFIRNNLFLDLIGEKEIKDVEWSPAFMPSSQLLKLFMMHHFKSSNTSPEDVLLDDSDNSNYKYIDSFETTESHSNFFIHNYEWLSLNDDTLKNKKVCFIETTSSIVDGDTNVDSNMLNKSLISNPFENLSQKIEAVASIKESYKDLYKINDLPFLDFYEELLNSFDNNLSVTDSGIYFDINTR